MPGRLPCPPPTSHSSSFGRWQLREKRYGACGYEPSGSLDDLAPKAFYLKHIDELYRRTYARKD